MSTHTIRAVRFDDKATHHLRITFRYARIWIRTNDDPGAPEEIDLTKTERLDCNRWHRAPEHDAWAEAWLAEHFDDAMQEVAIDDHAAAIERAETARDQLRDIGL